MPPLPGTLNFPSAPSAADSPSMSQDVRLEANVPPVAPSTAQAPPVTQPVQVEADVAPSDSQAAPDADAVIAVPDFKGRYEEAVALQYKFGVVRLEDCDRRECL